MKIESAACTHVGRRANNEDAFLTASDLGLFVVADGMGGYEGGEIASQLTIQTIQEFFARQQEDEEATWPYALERELTFTENMVSAAVRMASRKVSEKKVGKLASMGSTVAMLVLRGEHAIIGHLGDSRVYRLRGGTLTRITRDHSLYEQLKESNSRDLPPEEEFAYGNIITRAVGMPGSARPDIKTELPLPGDIYLLCTDGVTGPLRDERIAEILQNPSLEEACRNLVQGAYEQGGKDNITAVLVRVKHPEARMPQSPPSSGVSAASS